MNPQDDSSVCRLCKKQAALLQSHIYPKFIIKWLKDTGTGFVRSGQNMNQRRQDGFKVPLLCANCEKLFGKFETYFASSIFYPVVDREDNFAYDERLCKFVVSVMWRLMQHSLIDDQIGLPFFENVLRAEKEWAEYLLMNKPLNEFSHLHMWIGIDFSDEKEEVKKPDRFIQYLARMLDAGITDNGEDFCMFYLKLPRFIFIVPLTLYDESKWINTRVNINAGHYYVRNAGIEDGAVGQFILGRPMELENAMSQMSKLQREKMRQAGVDNWEKYKDKDLGDILDYQDNREV